MKRKFIQHVSKLSSFQVYSGLPALNRWNISETSHNIPHLSDSPCHSPGAKVLPPVPLWDGARRCLPATKESPTRRSRGCTGWAKIRSFVWYSCSTRALRPVFTASSSAWSTSQPMAAVFQFQLLVPQSKEVRVEGCQLDVEHISSIVWLSSNLSAWLWIYAIRSPKLALIQHDSTPV